MWEPSIGFFKNNTVLLLNFPRLNHYTVGLAVGS